MGEPLRYVPAFGSTRRLPDTGILPTQYIQRVVLGWSNEDESWHLGFLLEPELARPRGSRWCEIVNWPDPDGQLFGPAAHEAAETLAQTMERPFYFVPPQPAEQPIRRAAALPPLHAKIDNWSVALNSSGQIEATLTHHEARSRITRGIWYVLLSIIYFALSGLTLASGIALPRPEFLPYLGLAAAVLLLMFAVRAVFFPKKLVDRIVVHPEAKAIRGLAGGVDRWRFEADDIQAVYVSQIVQKPKANGTQALPYGEINLQLAGGRFQYVLHQGPTELTQNLIAFDGSESDGVTGLDVEDAHSSLQVLALHIAAMLGVPCLYDHRTK